MRVRPLGKSDRAEWMRMRCALWPGNEAELAEEVDRFYTGSLPEIRAVLIAEEDSGVVGCAELSIRSHAEGCFTHRVGYLEAWYVDESVRRRGIGRALVTAAEDWARSQGCAEFASDCQVTNEISAMAHLAIGFEEVERIRCFRKNL